MSAAVEVNFDGLIGPSHNYGGLSDGNLASANNAGAVSNPREAALQGLEKMRLLVKAGLTQGVLLPPQRPCHDLLVSSGFHHAGSDPVSEAAHRAPHILKAAYSASSMWAANAATVSPSADTQDGRLHLTVANLSTMLHRSIEHPDTTAQLIDIFGEASQFAVHAALPAHESFADEGAANHVRLAASHGAPGVELFVYGREGPAADTAFPARQTRLASACIAHSHGLDPARVVFARQSRRAIDAGAFHNDVVCVGTRETLFFHEHAFEDTDTVLDDIRRAGDGQFDLRSVMVPDAEVPLSDAISSYLFNSQLLAWPGEDRLVLLAPMETQETPSTRAFCERMVAGNGPIGRMQFVDVRQSMRNGGGPACLRLRVVMTPEEIAAANPAYLLDDAKIDRLQDAVRRTYRNALAPADLADPGFADECEAALEALCAALQG